MQHSRISRASLLPDNCIDLIREFFRRHGLPLETHQVEALLSKNQLLLLIDGLIDRLQQFIYILDGHPTLRTDEGDTQLAPSMCAGFNQFMSE